MADVGMSAEAHPDCYQWVLSCIQRELLVKGDMKEALRPQDYRAIGEFLIGDQEYRNLFVYYAQPEPKKKLPSDVKTTHFETDASGLNQSDHDEEREEGESAFPNDEEKKKVEKPVAPELTISVGVPNLMKRQRSEAVCNDVLYFVRLEPDKVLVPESMDYGVLHGVCRGNNFLESFLRSLRYVMVPTLLSNQWPSSIERDVQSSLHRFMATMVEDVNRLKGRTVLYVPSDLSLDDLSEAHNDRELVQRYESTVIHWTRQIKEVVGDRDNSSVSENAGPLEEIGYWKSRAHDLGNIRAQLNRPDVASIVSVLREAKSFYYLEPFLNLRADIERGTEEAFDILRYLNTLIAPSEQLTRADPKDIPSLIRPILQNVQLVLVYSKSYKKERFCGLLSMFSNEVIRRCSSKIDVASILKGDVAGSLAALEDSVTAGEAWIRECRAMLTATRRRFRIERGEKLEMDDSFLNGIDGFVRHRCKNLQEICKGQQQFGFKVRDEKSARTSAAGSRHVSRGTRHSSGMRSQVPDGAPLKVDGFDGKIVPLAEVFEGQIPTFSGNKGPEIESQLVDIQKAFRAKMEMLRYLDYDILDVKATKWVDDFRALKADVDSLSMMLRQVITASFDSISTITSGAEYIEAFYQVSKNEELLIQLDRSKDKVFRLLNDNMKHIQQDLQRYFNRKPPLFYLHPPYAGHGYWATNHLRQVVQNTQTLQLCYYLPNSPDMDEAQKLQDRIDRALTDTVRLQYGEWKSTVSQKPAEYLDCFLLVTRQGTGKGLENPPLYDVNFAKELSVLFEEVRFWKALGEVIPSVLQDISAKEDRLRVFRENVAQVTRDHNGVVQSLNKAELRLFSVRLQSLDTTFLPGLNRLQWNSQGIVEYFVKECHLQTEKVSQMVHDYKYALLFVDHHCQLITDTSAVIFERKKIYTPKSFAEKQESYRANVIAKLRKVHGLIVDKLYEIFRHFREDYSENENVRTEWHRLVEKMELKVEEALKTMVVRSLALVEKTLPKDSSEDRLDEKIFRLDVVISVEEDSAKPIIHTVPSTRVLGREINETCKSIIAVVQGLSRLEECLLKRIAEENPEELQEQNIPVVTYESNPSDSTALRGPYYEYMTGDHDAITSLRHIAEAFESMGERVHDKLTQTWQLHQSSSSDNLWTAQKQDKRIKQGWKLEDYRINMEHVVQRRDGIDKQEVFADVLFLQLDFSSMKETFRAQCQLVIQHYHGLLYAETKSELDSLYNSFETTIAGLTREPKTLDQLGEQIRQCVVSMSELPEVSQKFGPLSDKFELINSEAYNFGGVDPNDTARCAQLPEVFEAYSAQLKEAQKLLEKYKEQFLRDLETNLRSLITNSSSLYQQTKEEAPTTWELTTPVAFNQLEALERRARGLREVEKELQQGIEIFKLEKPVLDDLAKAEEMLGHLRNIWELAEKWRSMCKHWRNMYFMNLNSDKMLEGIEEKRKEVLGLRKELERQDVWVQFKDDIDLMKKILPIIDDLRTPAIRPRHWEMLKVQLDTAFNLEDEDSFNLQRLMDVHVERHAEFISNLATAAREELKIETGLEKIKDFWEEATFIIEPHQGYHKIASVDDINTALAEHLAMLSSMKMSRFADSFRPKVLQWEQTLSIVVDTIDALLTVQTKWMYLENIFVGSEDIKRKLVAESKKFDSIHAQWLTIMSRLINDPNVIRGARRDSQLDQLNTMNSELESIQKSLEGFLEDRRRIFPRFYFLSNDDLLEILGHTKEPAKVQPHLRKCFEGLYQLSLKTVRNKIVADGMSAADGEQVGFSPAVQVEGFTVETWLSKVESKMRDTVRLCILNTLKDLQETVYDARKPINRDAMKKWCEVHEGQPLITAACVNWTQQTEMAIVEYSDLHQNGLSLQRRKNSPLYKVYKKWKNMIRKYCQMVRLPQTRLQRNKLVALVTIEVHSRDILRHILANRVHSLDDFEWSRQLRFYSEPDPTTQDREGPNAVVVRQASAVVNYDYEYLGNSGRLVVTALTDRAYMTLTTALQLFRGGLPQGPAGTGKTETVKDLGKAIGKYVMVFNCSDGLDFRSVGRMLSGIAQTGAWSCFDEFNRIEVEVLSVVAQQIMSILTAVSERRE
ncbi:dynein heavy chain, axonemal [Angomonas deanei]|uniref:Dynein heavy chain, N-terminal region 1/Dynein heavy chain, N-terminal region 2/Hydrolytic ATP binding site of dynein motor region containing protein, putative n=1 Tax=Angomonas deanei TaxID=59799 RepID=A0A7G2CQF0_9TRYP|nr:dynein heavy chain, axonemal [Angomonas deanei]CAD2220773.1 Dynein heavy chain, N-terminal region 1/Dynein heavy chain, N-terminal region 2/Hydrolytic ATP binding site of dynein motor region containing protein, putative [Angomonas deanei]|eukprot:EPY38377.1 dynein heavy chain, axonemal [Angomonas deanei]